jgi:bifunctional DNA-binding transcriptional regulator/antitoxin component of YhaV-PrlF toxin-antitoxin module
MNESTLTERGQISVPAELRKSMRLHTGQRFTWQRISDREMRVVVEEDKPTGPLSVLGYARNLKPDTRRNTDQWMNELREGEAD